MWAKAGYGRSPLVRAECSVVAELICGLLRTVA
jgi:hypothetical protein